VDGDFPVAGGELRERGDSVRLVPYINKNFGARNLEYFSIQHFVAGGRRKVAIVFEEVLILFRINRRD
jgi:hypothetical protein